MLCTNRGFWKAFFLNLITLGIYNWYLIHAFAKETNIACKDDGKKTTGLLLYVVFNVLTLGIYGIVWTCMWINRCNNYLVQNGEIEGLQVSTYLLTLFLFGPLTLGIMTLVVYCKALYLQNKVNEKYNELAAC
jgi:hypothetical protein